MITVHVPAVRVPADHAASRVAAAVPARGGVEDRRNLGPAPPACGPAAAAAASGSPGGPAPPQPGYPAAWPRPRLNSLAVAALAFALIPGIPAVAAIIVGLMARSQISETGERGAAIATAAIVIGSLTLTAFLIFLVVAASA